MQFNPLVVFFAALAILFLGLTVLYAVLQRRVLRDQSRQVQELLAEARQMADEERRAGRRGVVARGSEEPADDPGPRGEDAES